MANLWGEIVLSVRGTGGYESGDILCAFHAGRIGCVHAEHACHPRKFGFTRDGLRQPSTLLETKQALSCQYRFQRVSLTEVERLDLETSQVTVFSDKTRPRIHVAEFLVRRRAHPDHKIFGQPGREYWFGGRYNPAVDAIWDEIEQHSPLRRADHTLWPLTDTEKRKFLGLRLTADFDSQTATELTAPELDAEGTKIRKRRQMVNWRALAGLNAKDIEDPSKMIDVREALQFDRTLIVQPKRVVR